MSPAKRVALTFDDGPNPPYTNQILDILKKENIKATFFVCGANIKRHPEVVERTVKEGHQIGNHTYYHRRSSYLLGKILEETQSTQQLIDEIDPKNKKLFRFPWGWKLPWFEKQLMSADYTIIGVGIFGFDWERGATAEKIIRHIAKGLKNKDKVIITLHDGHNADEGIDRSQTVLAISQIIKSLKSQGYKFTLPQGLKNNKGRYQEVN